MKPGARCHGLKDAHRVEEIGRVMSPLLVSRSLAVARNQGSRKRLKSHEFSFLKNLSKSNLVETLFNTGYKRIPVFYQGWISSVVKQHASLLQYALEFSIK